MTVDFDLAPEEIALPRLDARARLAVEHAQQRAIRNLAGTVRDSTEFLHLADMLGLDLALARAELPPLELTPVLPPPVDRPVRASSMPAALRDYVPPVTTIAAPPTRTPQPARPVPVAPAKGGPCAADCDRPAGHRGIHRPPLDEAAVRRLYVDERHDVATIAKQLRTGGPRVTAYLRDQGLLRPPGGRPAVHPGMATPAPAPADDYRAPGRVVLIPNDQKARCGNGGCDNYRGHPGRHRKPSRPAVTGACACGKPAGHTGAHRTGETEQVVTKLQPAHELAMRTWCAELDQSVSAYIRSLIIADLQAQGRLAPTHDVHDVAPAPAGVHDKGTAPQTPAAVPAQHPTDLDPAVIARRYTDGEGLFELASNLGIGVARLRTILNAQGVQLRKRGQVIGQRGPALRPIDEAECLRLYVDEHLDTVKVARHFGVKGSRVTDILRRHGVLRPPASKQLQPLDPQRCRDLYATGLSTAAVARHLGVQTKRVQDQLRADGLLRPGGRQRQDTSA